MPDVVIVGAGVSGLTLAHELAARGVDHLVLEASERVGGVMRSGRVEGHLLEWGPQRARLTPTFARLVDELGLRDRLIEAPRDLPLLVYRSGRLRRVPFSLGALMSSDILPLSSRLRFLAEPFTSAARDDETVGALFRRKLGRAAYETLAGPLYGGLFASDPDDMIVGLSLRQLLRELGVGRSLLLPLLRRGGRVSPPAAVSFVDGLEELPRALHARHGRSVRLDAQVRRLVRSGGGWRVELDGETLSAEHVVVTTPAQATRRLLGEVLPDHARRIGELVYNPLAVVHVHAETGLRALGYQVAFGEGLITRGVTFNDSLFARRGVYTIYLGGARSFRGERAEWRDAAGDIAVDEFRRVTGCAARVLSVAFAEMPAWDRSWAAIQGLELPRGLHVHANWYARPGLPGRLAGSRRLAERLATA